MSFKVTVALFSLLLNQIRLAASKPAVMSKDLTTDFTSNSKKYFITAKVTVLSFLNGTLSPVLT